MKKESLDILYNNLFSEVPSTENDHWDEFEIRLHKKMFYKFSWNRFNVYYLTLISLCVLTNIFVLSTFFNYSQPQNVEQKTTLYADSSKFETPAITAIEKNNSNKSRFSKTNYLNNADTNSVVNVIDQKNQDTITNAPIQSTPANPVTPTVAPVVIKRKSTVYISKRDTIINIDTIKVKKKR